MSKKHKRMFNQQRQENQTPIRRQEYRAPAQPVADDQPPITDVPAVVEIVGIIRDQVASACNALDHPSEDVASRMAPVRRNLFTLSTWPLELDGGAYRAYLINRMIRVDHDMDDLSRATVTIVLTDSTGEPAFCVEAYFTQNRSGSVIVIPMRPGRGFPDMPRSKLWTIQNGVVADRPKR